MGGGHLEVPLLGVLNSPHWSVMDPCSSVKQAVCGACLFQIQIWARETQHARKGQGTLRESILFSYHVRPEDQTQVVSLGGRCFSPLNHLSGPIHWFLNGKPISACWTRLDLVVTYYSIYAWWNSICWRFCSGFFICIHERNWLAISLSCTALVSFP